MSVARPTTPSTVAHPIERRPLSTGAPQRDTNLVDEKPKSVSQKPKTAVAPERRVKKTGAMVVEMGSGKCKAGFAGQATPKCVVGSVVGYPLRKAMKVGNVQEDPIAGNDARIKPDLKIIEPVLHGIIVDWDAATDVWRHVFYENLKVSPEEHAILLSDAPLSPTTNREKLAEVFFEQFSAPAMYVAYQSVLDVYSYGMTSGFVIDSGYGVTYSVPVVEGYNMPHATERMDLAGSDLTSYLLKLLQDHGYHFTEKGRIIVDDIKQKCCYVAADYRSEQELPESSFEANYELPDGQLITLGEDRFQCPEALFRPSVIDSSLPGIHTMAMNSLKKVPATCKTQMFGNILLCGGSTMFSGFHDRFQNELIQIAPKEVKVNINSVPEREYSAWIGGSILAALNSFQSLWVHQRDFKEYGPYIVHRRCY